MLVVSRKVRALLFDDPSGNRSGFPELASASTGAPALRRSMGQRLARPLLYLLCRTFWVSSSSHSSTSGVSGEDSKDLVESLKSLESRIEEVEHGQLAEGTTSYFQRRRSSPCVSATS